MTPREQLAAAYAKIPKLACAGKCQACCGPIVVTVLEHKQMDRHKPPANPRRKGDSLTCQRLDVAFGRCSVYPDRPTLCRLWGVVESMRCPWGCEPERVLTDEEGGEILREVGRISGYA